MSFLTIYLWTIVNGRQKQIILARFPCPKDAAQNMLNSFREDNSHLQVGKALSAVWTDKQNFE